MKIVSLQISLPEIIPATGSNNWWHKEWETSFYKKAFNEKIWLGYEGLEGDGNADRESHGGVDKALCLYSIEHYDYWKKIINPELKNGAFGENLTVSHLLEKDVCIGDIYKIGDTQVQVSQPRQPCWKLARRWRIKDLTKQVEDNGLSGFYFRVLKDGYLQSGESIELIKKGHKQWTIARCNDVMNHQRHDLKAAQELASVPELSGSWKDCLTRRFRQE